MPIGNGNRIEGPRGEAVEKRPVILPPYEIGLRTKQPEMRRNEKVIDGKLPVVRQNGIVIGPRGQVDREEEAISNK